MKTLLSLLLLIPTLSWANFDNWNCVKLEKNNFSCTTSFDGSKVRYTGNIKNSQPNGYGYYEALDWDMKGKGTWKFNGIYLGLNDGEINAEGNIIYYQDGNPVKLNYANGNILEIISNSEKTSTGKLFIVGGDVFIGRLDPPLIIPTFLDGEYKFFNGDRFEGSFYKNNNFKEGELTFKNGNKYIGTWKDNNEYLNGKFFYNDGTKVIVTNGNFSKQFNTKKYFNIYSIFFIFVFILFLFFKFGNDFYEKKRGSPKAPISLRFLQFWTSPIGSWIFTIVILFIIVKISLLTPTGEERAPAFFGDVT